MIPAKPKDGLCACEIEKAIADPRRNSVDRTVDAFRLAWLRRCEQGVSLELSALHVNDVTLLHLPGECFVEYQLREQAMRPDRFVATAAYCDGGPWYIPTHEAYPQGGYEVESAFCGPEMDGRLTNAIREVLA